MLKSDLRGRPVAQLVERAPHVQGQCPRHSGPGFDSTCCPLLRVIPPVSSLFPVYSSAVLTKEILKKGPKKYLLKNKKRVIYQKFCCLILFFYLIEGVEIVFSKKRKS